MMRTFSRISGDFRKQFDQALREAERELEIEETRKSVEAAIKDASAPAKATPQQKDQGKTSQVAEGGRQDPVDEKS